MIINIGKQTLIDRNIIELIKEDSTSRCDKSHIYDLMIHKSDCRCFAFLMFAHKEDRDTVYNEIVKAIKGNGIYECDIFELYDVKIQ